MGRRWVLGVKVVTSDTQRPVVSVCVYNPLACYHYVMLYRSFVMTLF